MANLSKQVGLSDLAATELETFVKSGLWLNWILRWNKNKDTGIQEDINIGFKVDTVLTSDRRTEVVRILE